MLFSYPYKFLALLLLIILSVAAVDNSFAQTNVISDTEMQEEALGEARFIDAIEDDENNGPVECVILVPGLNLEPESMSFLANSLAKNGYKHETVHYQSHRGTIAELSLKIEDELLACRQNSDAKIIHMVGHSFGAILIRHYIATSSPHNLGKIILIAPPNHGTRIVNFLARNPDRSSKKYGEAFLQLGTGKSYFVNKMRITHPRKTGIIAGTGHSSIKDFFLSMYLRGVDDGVVSVASTRLKGVKNHITVPHSHHNIIFANETFQRVQYFLKNGSF